MVKKISISLSNPFRIALDKNENYQNSVGVRKAFGVSDKIVQFCLSSTERALEDVKAFAVEMSFHENDLMGLWAAFVKAYRMEIELHHDPYAGHGDTSMIHLDLNLYERGAEESESFFWLEMECYIGAGWVLWHNCRRVD